MTQRPRPLASTGRLVRRVAALVLVCLFGGTTAGTADAYYPDAYSWPGYGWPGYAGGWYGFGYCSSPHLLSMGYYPGYGGTSAYGLGGLYGPNSFYNPRFFGYPAFYGDTRGYPYSGEPYTSFFPPDYASGRYGFGAYTSGIYAGQGGGYGLGGFGAGGVSAYGHEVGNGLLGASGGCQASWLTSDKRRSVGNGLLGASGGCGQGVLAGGAVGGDGGCGVTYQTVTETVYDRAYDQVPEVVNRTRMVPQVQTRPVTCYRNVPVVTPVTRAYTVTVYDRVPQTITVPVRRYATEHVTQNYTVTVPEYQTRTATRPVTKCVPVTTYRTVTRDAGHYQTEQVYVPATRTRTIYQTVSYQSVSTPAPALPVSTCGDYHVGGCGLGHGLLGRLFHHRWGCHHGCGGPCYSCSPCGGLGHDGCGVGCLQAEPVVTTHTCQVPTTITEECGSYQTRQTWVPNLITEQVPVTTATYQTEMVPYSYSVCVPRYETRTRTVPVTRCYTDYQTQTVTRLQPRYETRTCVVNVTTYRSEPYTYNQSYTTYVPQSYQETVYRTVCRMVPRQVSRQVAVPAVCPPAPATTCAAPATIAAPVFPGPAVTTCVSDCVHRWCDGCLHHGLFHRLGARLAGLWHRHHAWAHGCFGCP